MGAMRKAGIWLGLIEDEDDRGYGNGYEESDEFAEEEQQAHPSGRGARSAPPAGSAAPRRGPQSRPPAQPRLRFGHPVT